MYPAMLLSYTVGTVFSVAMLLLFRHQAHVADAISSFGEAWIFFGILLSICIGLLLTFVASKIVAVYQSVLMSVGQVVAAAFLDWAISGKSSVGFLIGCALILLGVGWTATAAGGKQQKTCDEVGDQSDRQT